MKLGIIALIPLLCLTGCFEATFNKKAQSLVSPNVPVYTQEQLNAAVDEMKSCKAPMLEDMMKDYCVMRDQSRILAGNKPVCTAPR